MTGKRLGLVIFVSLFLLSSQAKAQSRTSEQDQDYPVKVFGLTSNDDTVNGDSDITMFSSAKSIAGIVVMMVIGGLASAGGGSGGALYICILLIFFTYTENQCVQIVYGLVFAGALGNIINVARNVETKTKRPLIDYDLALLLMPAMALGNGVGIILSKMAAPAVIIACLYLMLIYTLYKFILKLRSDLAKEKKAKKVKIQQIEQQVEVSIDSSTGLLNPFLKPQPKYVQFPLIKIAVLVLLLAFTIFFALLRGTGNVPSIVNVSFCSGGFWGIFVGGLAVCLVFAIFTQNYLSSKNKLIQINHENSFSTVNGYPRLDRKTMTKLNGLGLLAGVLGGLLGIGGVMVINPTLLSLGFATEIVAATSTFLILQTSLMALIQSFLEKDVPVAEQLIFMGISLVGGFMVSFVLKKLIEKYQKPTIILMILVGLVVVSMVATPVSEIFDYKGQYYEMLEFHDFCSSG